jgi:peroxiredoxin
MSTMNLTMNRPRQLGIIAALAVALLLLSSCIGGGRGATDFGPIDWTHGDADTGPEIGQRAPNFRLETADGETLILEERLGQPVILNFWATWCANCREELEALQAVSEGETTVIGVDLRETAGKVQAMADATGATYAMALDRKGTVNRAYRVTSLPVTYVLDAEGTVREIIRGPIEEENLREIVARVAVPRETS